MNRTRRIGESLLGIGWAGLFAAQLVHTWRNENRWPLCSYNMFNRTLPERFPQPRVTLHDDSGMRELLPVYGLLPVEFFRAVAICGAVYLENEDDQIKRRFSAAVVDRLNEHPWADFDEVRASHRPCGQFHGLDFYVVWMDLSDYDPDGDAPLHDAQLVYSYRRQQCP